MAEKEVCEEHEYDYEAVAAYWREPGSTLAGLYERFPEYRPSLAEVERNEMIADLRAEGYHGHISLE